MNIEALNAVLLENFDEALNAKSGEGWFDGLNPTLAQIDAATASTFRAEIKLRGAPLAPSSRDR